MGKRIISQARGRGGPTYRVRKKAFVYKIAYNSKNRDVLTAVVLKLIHSRAHSAPLAKIQIKETKDMFYNVAAQGLYEGQEIEINTEKIEYGNVVALKHIPLGVRVFNIEKRPSDGGKMVRVGGGYATVNKKAKGTVTLLMRNKKLVTLNEDCRVTIGEAAGQGRTNKPMVKAGNKFHKMKSKSKLWPRTSAVKVNAVDHPFGGGRGKRIKSKIAKRNAPPGRKVGHIRPKQTGKRR
jgi:large subunit ribosomal protein L2